MALPEEESKKEIATGEEQRELNTRMFFDLFSITLQQLNKLDTKIDGLRQEIKQEIGGLRQEMRQEINGLRQEIDGLKQETRQEINGLRQEMRQEVQVLRQEIQGVHQEVHNTTRWIIGTIVATVGVAVAVASWLF